MHALGALYLWPSDPIPSIPSTVRCYIHSRRRYLYDSLSWLWGSDWNLNPMIARSREIPPSGTFQIRCQLTWRQIKNLPSLPLSHGSPFLHKMPEFFQFKNCRFNYSSESVNNALGLIDGMSIIVQDRSDEKAGRGTNPGVRVPLWLSAGPCLTFGATWYSDTWCTRNRNVVHCC